MLIAGLDLDAEHQPQSGHEVSVVAVGRTSRLLRVVGHHGPFLLAIQGLDGGVDVEDPGGVEQGRDAVAQVPIQPGHALRFRDRAQRPAQGVFGDDLVHAEQPRIDPVAADGGDVGIAPVAR